MFVLAAVLSRPDKQTATIDAGWKALSVDCGAAMPLDKRWSYRATGDEHGTLTGEGIDSLKVGDRVTLVPSHCDTTLALHELYYVIENDLLKATWPIETRGPVQ